jgi:hypothetical protein
MAVKENRPLALLLALGALALFAILLVGSPYAVGNANETGLLIFGGIVGFLMLVLSVVYF